MNDLYDLFTLGDLGDGTETGGMFSGAEKSFNKGYSNAKGKKKKMRLNDNEDDFMQVAKMTGVSSLEDFQGGAEATGLKDEDSSVSTANGEEQGSLLNSAGSRDEDRIMEGIFAKSGVHSSLEHDAIMSQSMPDQLLVEKEASRVAKNAVEALRASRKMARKAEIGVPTWTGKFGSAGRAGGGGSMSRSNSSSPGPSSRRFGAGDNNGMSSASILQGMRRKRELERGASVPVGRFGNNTNNNRGRIQSRSVTPDVLPSSSSPAASTPPKTHEEKIKSICEYLNKQSSYEAKSKDIINNCGIVVSDVQEVANIRQTLKEIAEWDGRIVKWVLKPEFREN
ncbi:hypothetical protein D0Z00_000092 [Geotrichum galactomycetum]|uniref:Uncharacterized protein n=1 Tax=Geotrichum galactomycetum TaxID=27317 RepID=A0ACB6VAX5_9ASCO|nr:hypothetical protein D0Z00_000092 [Geotrichum candidum]